MKKIIALHLFLGLAVMSFSQTLTSSNLPIIKINTSGSEIPDEPKITATMGIINGAGPTNNVTDPFTDYDGPIGIEVRGNSTAEFDKKTYAIELRTPAGLDSSKALLGMPEEEDWILHAMVIDKSLLRIPMSFYFMQEMGHYAARWRYVELILNDDYRGVYIMTERIKRDKNRVDIAKLKESDTLGVEVTGGYILRIDWQEEDAQGFDSEYNSMADMKMFFQWYYPKADKIQPAQAAYIENYIDEFEEALFSPTNHNSLGKHYSQYIDLTSFADFVLINELSKNSDGYKLSSYIHKQKVGNGNKILAGPMWDFDQTYGVSLVCGCDDYTGWHYSQTHPACEDFESMPMWYDKLMSDPLFQNHIKCRWEEHRAGHLHKDSINAWIDTHVALLDEAKDRNFTKWPVIGEYIWIEPDPVPETYAEEITVLRDWISNRIDWLDTNMPGDCASDVVGNMSDSNLMMKIYPNPADDMIRVDLPLFVDGTTYRIFDLKGRFVKAGDIESQASDINVSELATGTYVFEAYGPLGIIREKFVKG